MFGTPLMFFTIHRQGKLPDCSRARWRNNHCHSKFICSAITVHFKEVVQHLNSEMFSYILITTALWPFVYLLKKLFLYVWKFTEDQHVARDKEKKALHLKR